jgi:hypothetical protein
MILCRHSALNFLVCNLELPLISVTRNATTYSLSTIVEESFFSLRWSFLEKLSKTIKCLIADNWSQGRLFQSKTSEIKRSITISVEKFVVEGSHEMRQVFHYDKILNYTAVSQGC